MPDSNARFLPESRDPAGALLRDLRDGLRYIWHGTEKTFSWRTTYLDLDTLSFVRRTPHDRFGWPVYRFEVPLRLGALEIEGLQVNVPNDHMSTWRFDVPLDHFPFEIRLHGDGAENYWQVKAYLSAALGAPPYGLERTDQLHSEWENDGLKVERKEDSGW
jgi:hypothetical protein